MNSISCPSENFSQWVFNSLIEKGVILDYDKNPHTGKGRKPAGNLSLKPDRIASLRQSIDHNAVLWGLVGTSLTNNAGGKVGTRLSNLFKDFATAYCATHPEENATKLHEIMVRASSCAGQEWNARFIPTSDPEFVDATEVVEPAEIIDEAA